MIKLSDESNSKYLISEDQMKKIRVERMITWSWRMSKDPSHTKKIIDIISYDVRASEYAVATRSLEDFEAMSEEKTFSMKDTIV